MTGNSNYDNGFIFNLLVYGLDNIVMTTGVQIDREAALIKIYVDWYVLT